VNGTLLTRDGRSVLRFERLLRHPPEKVWRAITEPEQLAGWFPGRIEGEREAGAPLRFVPEGGEPTEGKVIDFEPPRLFSYTWGDSVLRFELRPDAAGTVLVFTHTFDERPSAASFAAGWHQCLDGLDAVVAGRPAPAPTLEEGGTWRGYRVRHEAYVEVFGLLAGVVAGGAVRFDRLLPYPAGRVWAAIAGDGATVGAPVPAAATSAAAPGGAVTEVDQAATLAYTGPGGAVRWGLSPGPGGTLVTLTHQVPPADRVAALAAWHARIESLAADLAAPDRGTEDQEALHRRYETPSEVDTSP
jgi:uncharacterized protein YndB with AHSA1/START domain